MVLVGVGVGVHGRVAEEAEQVLVEFGFLLGTEAIDLPLNGRTGTALRGQVVMKGVVVEDPVGLPGQ
eukprot:9292916-Heterocapsa_arctica.AAC.1